MGLDFTALIRYGGTSGNALEAIANLGRGEEEPAFAEVVACGSRNDAAFARYADPQPRWRLLTDWKQMLAQRPPLPSLETCLHLPSDLSLTFGQDAVRVYHTLRWLIFLTDSEWQRVMLGAIKRFCELLEACDCILTNDCHPAVSSFSGGGSFTEALEAAVRGDEGEVASLSELYREVKDDSDLAVRPVRGFGAEQLEGQIVRWPRSKPLPKDWSRATSWDSKGFWRYKW